MNRLSIWLWITTASNIIVATLVIFILWSMFLALAAFAAFVSGWPLFIALSIGATISIVGLWLARGAPGRISRWTASIVNGCTLAVHLLIVGGIAILYFRSTEEIFIIPPEFKGDIYVVYGSKNCQPLDVRDRRITYRIPGDGILRVCGKPEAKWTRTLYYFEQPGRTLRRIQHYWPTTIHHTPENLANDSDFGVFFPRSGTVTDAGGCTVEYQMFYVGTKRHLLGDSTPSNLLSYLRENPVGCKGRD